MELLIFAHVLQVNQNGGASKDMVWCGSTYIKLVFVCKTDESEVHPEYVYLWGEGDIKEISLFLA
jgi:hypothetical protein